jgi:C-terminal processing protease CtpA/Prc
MAHPSKPLVLILVLLCLLSLTVAAQVPSQPLRNLQLEQGELGQVPTGWFGNMPGYNARLLAEGAAAGKRAVEIEFKEPNPQSNFGLLRQTFDATAYRGKRVRFRAAVRMEGETPQDRAQLWFRVDRIGGVGFFDNMDARPIRSRDWQYFEITGDVADDAQLINLGMMLIQRGRAWVSDMTLDVLGDVPKPVIEPARPLTSRGLRNETAFAKLFGYVRYFHPSDEAFRTDWDALAIRGARAVEGAKDDAELAQTLLTLFQPISPTLRIVTAGQQYVRPAELNSPGANAKITYWKHHGVGMGRAASGYHSERVQETAATASAPLRGDLGEGLVAWVPSSLYVDEQGTLPRTRNIAETPVLQPTATAEDRGTRLADVILAWNVFEHFYPYFDVVKTDWTAELPIALQKAAVDPTAAAFTETLQRMVAALHDGHGAVNSRSGIGMGMLPLQWAWVEGDLVITAVDPAAGLNVSIGDTVLIVNGYTARVALEAREELVSGATPQWIRFRALQELRTGPFGQMARLEVESQKEPGKVTIVSTIYGQPRQPLLDDKRPDKIAELEPGLFYIDIGRVSEADFNAALGRLQTARGLVFDFRGYPSIGPTFLTRLYDKPLTSAQWHIPDVTLPNRQNMTFSRGGEWNLQPTAPLLTAKRAFIVDGRAISYAESCLGIIENYKLGEIVGAPSAGTNGNVNPFPLPGDYTISWTGMKVLKHDGGRHHGVGIQPTIPVSRTKAGIAAGRDEFLERAVTAVK